MWSTSSRSSLLEKEEKAAAAHRSKYPEYQVDRPVQRDLFFYAKFYSS